MQAMGRAIFLHGIDRPVGDTPIAYPVVQFAWRPARSPWEPSWRMTPNAFILSPRRTTRKTPAGTAQASGNRGRRFAAQRRTATSSHNTPIAAKVSLSEGIEQGPEIRRRRLTGRAVLSTPARFVSAAIAGWWLMPCSDFASPSFEASPARNVQYLSFPRQSGKGPAYGAVVRRCTTSRKTACTESTLKRSRRGVACPICGSARTKLYRDNVRDLEYFVEPPRPLLVHRCEECASEFLAPRPQESDLPPFYPSDYHAYNENHSGVARLLVQYRARARARLYGGLIPGGRGRIFDVGTGDCRHFDELRRYLDLECAGVEIQPDVAAKGRARGYDVIEGTLEGADLSGHLGRYDVVSMNHVLEHVVQPHTMLERAFDLLRPGGHLIGQLPTVSSWEHSLFGPSWGGYHYPRHLQIPSRTGLLGILEDVGFSVCEGSHCPSHPDDDLASELVSQTRVASPDAQREDADLRRASHGCVAVRVRCVVIRQGWHRRFSRAEATLPPPPSG